MIFFIIKGYKNKIIQSKAATKKFENISRFWTNHENFGELQRLGFDQKIQNFLSMDLVSGWLHVWRQILEVEESLEERPGVHDQHVVTVVQSSSITYSLTVRVRLLYSVTHSHSNSQSQ